MSCSKNNAIYASIIKTMVRVVNSMAVEEAGSKKSVPAERSVKSALQKRRAAKSCCLSSIVHSIAIIIILSRTVQWCRHVAEETMGDAGVLKGTDPTDPTVRSFANQADLTVW